MAAVGRGSRRRVDPTPLTVGAAVGRCPGLESVCTWSSSVLHCCCATTRRRRSSAASCTMVRDHTTWAQWNVNTIAVIQATMSPIPGPG